MYIWGVLLLVRYTLRLVASKGLRLLVYWVFLWVEVPMRCSLPLLIYSLGGKALVRILTGLQVGSLVGSYVYIFYALSIKLVGTPSWIRPGLEILAHPLFGQL